jgi:hypothetical protein
MKKLITLNNFFLNPCYRFSNPYLSDIRVSQFNSFSGNELPIILALISQGLKGTASQTGQAERAH